MEEPNNTPDHQHSKKTAVKISAGSSIGAVLLLGGALATAAFVSTFIRKRGWGFGKDKDRRRQRKNPLQESGKPDELDGTNKGEDFVLYKSSSAQEHHLRNGETKVIEPEDTTGSFEQGVKKVRVEINDGDEGIPKVLENGSEELEDTIPEDITILASIESDELNVITKGTQSFDAKCEAGPNEMKIEAAIVYDTVAFVEQASSLEPENNLNVQENDSAEEKSEEVIEKIEDGVAEIGKEHLSEGPKQEAEAVPFFDTPAVVEYEIVNGNEEAVVVKYEVVNGNEEDEGVVEYEVVNGNEDEGALATKIVEIVQVDEVVDGSHEDGMGCAKDELVEKQEKCDQKPVDVVVSESCAGKACASNPENDVQNLAPEKEINLENMDINACTNPVVESCVSCEVETEEDGDAVNEAVAENREANEDIGLASNSWEGGVVEANKLASPEITEVKEKVEDIHCDTVTAKDNMITPTSNENNVDSNNGAEESGAKQVPQQAKLTQENEHDESLFRPNGMQTEKCNSKTKYVVKLAKLKGRAAVIALLSVVSSLSCSWYFGLSLLKLCAVLFLTVFVSKLHA